jgi:hypothetical protein
MWSPSLGSLRTSGGDGGLTGKIPSPNSSSVSVEEVQACIRDLKNATRQWNLGSIDETGLQQEIARIKGRYRRLLLGCSWDSDAYERSPSSVHPGLTFNRAHEAGSASSSLTAERQTGGMEPSVLAQESGRYPPPSTPEKKERLGTPVPFCSDLPSIPEEPEPPSGPSSPQRGSGRTSFEDEVADIDL